MISGGSAGSGVEAAQARGPLPSGAPGADAGKPEETLRLAHKLDEEERELWKQLRRKRDFESRVAEKRTQLEELRDRRRSARTAHAEALASVEHLSGELEFAREQGSEFERDIAVLRESNRILQDAFSQQQPRAHVDPRETRDVIAEEKRRQESLQLQHEQITHLRAHLEKIRAEKNDLQLRQQALFDKQRAAEQDRNRLLGSLQDDRGGINELRQERIKLCEERARLEREMAQLVKEAPSLMRRGNTDNMLQWQRLPAQPVPGAFGGVRGHVVRDTPQAFADPHAGAGSPPWGSAGTSSPRPHWTGFGADSSPPGGGAACGASNGYLGTCAAPPPSFGDLANMGTQGGTSPGGVFGGGSPGGAFGVSVGALGSGGLDGSSSAAFDSRPTGLEGTGPSGGGITEWAGRVRDFRSGAGGGD